MTIDAAYVKMIGPEFENVSDTRIDFFITIAALSVDADVFGDFTDPAHGYLTAHLLTISSRNGASGQVKREKVGDLEVEYADEGKSIGLAELNATGYGREYLRIRKSVVRTPVLAQVGCT